MTSYDYLMEAVEERAEKRATKRVEEVMGRLTEEVTGRVTEEVTQRKDIEVIRKARLKGATIEFIADIVGLSSEKVRNILDELGIE